MRHKTRCQDLLWKIKQLAAAASCGSVLGLLISSSTTGRVGPDALAKSAVVDWGWADVLLAQTPRFHSFEVAVVLHRQTPSGCHLHQQLFHPPPAQ